MYLCYLLRGVIHERHSRRDIGVESTQPRALWFNTSGMASKVPTLASIVTTSEFNAYVLLHFLHRLGGNTNSRTSIDDHKAYPGPSLLVSSGCICIRYSFNGINPHGVSSYFARKYDAVL